MKSFTFYFAAPLAIFLLSFTSAGAQVFSNEIHYDNLGLDVNERIEVAGPAGTDLSGWSIILYNGNGGIGVTYGTANLSGTLANQCTVSGQNIGTHVTPASAFVPTTAIQGGPDGWALVHSGVVVEFLSYEGAFPAVDGPAAGMMSIDIGALEGETSTDQGSIQLQFMSGMNTWVTNLTSNTFGACNGTGGSSQSLPVTLSEFTATPSPNGIKLSWTTASETKNDYFTIERASDGVHFIPIGEKDGNGTTAHGSSYSFTDEQPLKGNNYYRLKQIDEDGTSTYSPVRVVRLGKAEQIAVYPNPTSTGNFNINYNSESEGTLQVSLKNAAGVEVSSQIVNVYKGYNLIPVSSVNNPDGPYWMVITTESQTNVVPVQVKTH